MRNPKGEIAWGFRMLEWEFRRPSLVDREVREELRVGAEAQGLGSSAYFVRRARYEGFEWLRR